MKMEEKVNNDKFITSKEFIALQEDNIRNIISLLLMKNEIFQLRVPADKVALNPLLPMDIIFSFDENMLFGIEGYSFETFYLDKYSVSFQAAFGPDNIETTVSFELRDIHMVLREYERPLCMNLCAFIEDDIESLEIEESGVNKSMASFMLNPENQKFFK